jgi:hypothetical protein
MRNTHPTNHVNPLIGLILVQTIAITLTLSCSSPEDEVKDDPTGSKEYLKEREEQAKYYDPDDAEQRCENGVTEWKCGENGAWYNPTTHACSCHQEGENGVQTCKIHGVLEGLCGIKMDVVYNLGTQYCTYGASPEIVKEKAICGDRYYMPYSDTRCQDGIVQQKCDSGENWYNKETQYCSSNGTVETREPCGNLYIVPGSYKCDNGVVEELCDRREKDSPYYNTRTQKCLFNYDEDSHTTTYTVKSLERCGG